MSVKARLTTRLAAGVTAVLTATVGLVATVASPAGATPATGPKAGTGAAPVIWTGSELATTSVTAHGGDLLFFWQADGSPTWNEKVIAKDHPGTGTTTLFSDPSLVWTGTDIVVIAQVRSDFEGMGGYSLSTWTARQGSSKWTEHGSGLGSNTGPGGFLSGAVPYETPSIAWTGGNLVVSAVGPVGVPQSGQTLPSDVNFWWQDSSGTYHQEVVGAQTNSASWSEPAMTVTNNQVVIAAIRNGTDLISWYEPYGQPKFLGNGISGGGGGFGFKDPSLAWSGSDVILASAVVGPSSYVKYFYQPDGGHTWSSSDLPALPGLSGPDFSGGTAIVWTGSNPVIAAFDTKNDALGFWWQTSGGTAWHPEVLPLGSGQKFNGYPTMTASSDAVFIVMSQTSGLVRWAQEFGTAPWRPQVISG
jgi:hypothetical protein